MVTPHLPAPKRLRAGRLAPRRQGLVRDTEDTEDNFLLENRSKIPRSVRGRYRFSINLTPYPLNAPDGVGKLFLCPENSSGQRKNLFLRDLCASVVKVNNFILWLRCPVKDFSEFLNEVGERSRCEGKEESEKGKARNELSLPIERSFVIQGSWMSKTEKNDEHEQKEPPGIVKDGNKRHHRYRQ
jgi:hypothetical protein